MKYKFKKYRVLGFQKEKEGVDLEDSYIESKVVLLVLDIIFCYVIDLMFYYFVVFIRWKMRD